MKRRIPTFDEFEINESLEGGPPKMRKTRAVGAILKAFQKSRYYTPEEIYNIEYWDKLRNMVRNHDSDDFSNIFLTPGEWPWSSKAEDRLADKLVNIWKEVKKKDPKIEQMYNEWVVKRDEEIKIAKEKKNAEDLKKKKLEAKKLVAWLKKNNLLEIHEYQEKYNWLVKRNPWSMPKANFKETKMYNQTEMQKGKRYIGRGTDRSGSSGSALMFPTVIEWVDKDIAIILMETGMYGPSVWISVNQKGSKSKVDFSGQDYDEWYKANKNELKAMIKKFDTAIEKMGEDTDELPFDPYWGMN